MASMRRLRALSLLLLGASAGFGQQVVRLEKTADAMGSTFAVVLYGTDRDAMESAADAALDEAIRIDAVLSNYKPASEWSRVNRDAAAGPVKISPELFELLSACVTYSSLSEGAFDITVGPLMKTWGFYKASNRLPKPAEVATVLRKVGYRHLHLDAAAHTVSFDSAGVEIDPGGIGKGYAVDRMVDILKQHGIAAALAAGSDSSIYGLGAPPEEPRGWKVNIRDPWHPDKTAAEVFLKDMSLSTSGSYEKFFQAEGRTYSHIMDPRTGYPAQGVVSVSVTAPRTIDSEAWAKPFFVNGRQWTAAHLPAGVSVYLCEDALNRPCTWLGK